MVLNADQTEDVLFGDAGVVPMLKPGSVVLACATVPPEFAREMEARCRAVGLHYLDAPISGGSVKAAAGIRGNITSDKDVIMHVDFLNI